MKKFFLFSFAFWALSLSAQKKSGMVKGVLVDGTTATKQPLADATISIMKSQDSSLVSFTLTSPNGSFEIKNLDYGSYYLLVSYQGFETLKKSFTLSPLTPIQDLAELKMGKAFKTLNEVVVTDMAPIKVKNDTVEFNAASFKTKPNATVEDLLKKLPGVQVDKDGTVKAQGEQVQKVYVDGKEFFGNDPKLVTKNLSADMVESVQVYDDMSDQAKFTKIDDGSKSKAINIKLKKDKKNGLFGKAMAGYGTHDRYEATVNLNRFKGSRQLSFIGAANNVNKQGFSFSDVIGAMGGFGAMNRMNGEGGGGSFGGGNLVMNSRTGGGGGSANPFMASPATGIATPLSGGLNYRDAWGKKIEVSSSLFYSHTATDKMQHAFSRFLGLDSTTDSKSSSHGVNQNTRFNFRVEYRIDSMNTLLYTPNFTLQHSDNHSTDTALTQAMKGTIPYKVFSSQTQNSSDRDGYNINQNLLWRHRFNRPGRTLTLGWNNTLNHSDGNGSVYSPVTYYRNNNAFTNLQDQQSSQKTDAHNNVFSSSYTEPVGRNKIIELNYAFTNNHSTSDRKAFNYNPSSGRHDVVSAAQTNYFSNEYLSNRVGANFRVQEPKYNYQLGMGVQMGQLTSHSFKALGNKDTTLRQHYTNLFPTANFTYSFSRTKSLRFNYRGRTNQPSVSQLQDVPDLTNPLQVTSGNPALGQEFINSINLGYNTFNILTFKYWAANINFSQTAHKIVNSIDTFRLHNSDPILRQITRPVNRDGAYTGSAFFTLGLPFKSPKLKGSSMNFNSIAVFNHNLSLLYGQKNFNTTLVLTQTIGFNYNRKDKLDAGLNGSITYNNLKYSLQPGQNTHYLSQTYSLDLSYTLPKNFILASDFDYFVTSGRAAGYNQAIPMWNASFAKQFLKSKQAELKLSVSDILNQNKSFTRTTADNYVQDVESNVLRRYFLLAFTYNLNRMGGKNVMQMPRMMERNIRNIRVIQ